MYQLQGSPNSVLIPSRADIANLPVDLLNSMFKRRSFKQAEKSVHISFDNAVVSTFLERFKTRLEQNAKLSDAFYGEAYESYKDEHFFNLGEHHHRFGNINPYSNEEKHFIATQHKERMELLVASCWDTFIDSSGAFPHPTLVWDDQDTTNKNYLDAENNKLHITAYNYSYEQSSAQTMIACVLSHCIDLTAEGKLMGGFGAYGLSTRNKIPEQVNDPQVDVTRAEMQAIVCRKASKAFLNEAERAMREHLFTDIEDASLHALNPHQRNSLLMEVHPVGTCYDTDGTDPKYRQSFFSSVAAKNNFILRVNANCPMDEIYQRMYNEAQDAFWRTDFAASFSNRWESLATQQQLLSQAIDGTYASRSSVPYYQKLVSEQMKLSTALVKVAFQTIERCWRQAARENCVLTDATQSSTYFGELKDQHPYVDRSSGKRTLHDTTITIGNKTYQVQGRYRGEEADTSIGLVPYFDWTTNWSKEHYIQQGAGYDSGNYQARVTRGHILHLPYTQDNWFWRASADEALKYLGWMYIVDQHNRIAEAYMCGRRGRYVWKGGSKVSEEIRLKQDNPFYAFASRASTWHDAGDISRLNWMVSRIDGHERDGMPMRLADNFLNKPVAGMPSPK